MMLFMEAAGGLFLRIFAMTSYGFLALCAVSYIHECKKRSPRADLNACVVSMVTMFTFFLICSSGPPFWQAAQGAGDMVTGQWQEYEGTLTGWSSYQRNPCVSILTSDQRGFVRNLQNIAPYGIPSDTKVRFCPNPVMDTGAFITAVYDRPSKEWIEVPIEWPTPQEQADSFTIFWVGLWIEYAAMVAALLFFDHRYGRRALYRRGTIVLGVLYTAVTAGCIVSAYGLAKGTMPPNVLTVCFSALVILANGSAYWWIATFMHSARRYYRKAFGSTKKAKVTDGEQTGTENPST